jgi:pullulanase/glycogen debranching enzyme
LRTKNGIPDSYQAGDSINKVDWARKKLYRDVSDAYAQLITTRRRFAGLRLSTKDEIDRALRIQMIAPGFFELRIAGNKQDRKELLILLNSGGDRAYELPQGEWNLVLEQGRLTKEQKASGRINAGGTAASLLYR